MEFTDAWLDELRARNDIVSLVSTYVQLKQKGQRWWGLCPFHSEATASFSVSEDTQLYYCFGCHAGGSVIQFIMAAERLDFVEAVTFLADRARMELPADAGRIPRGPRADKHRLTEAMNAAARVMNETLWTPEGAEALAYLKRRGVSDGSIRAFGLGVTPRGWDGLTSRLIAQGYTLEELVAAGLSTERSGRVFDAFRERLMFPIVQTKGRVVGFGGRIMGEGQPKYLNTGDTPLFNKRRNLYGVHLLPRSPDRLWLVEGYMDVVALAQGGVIGAVATLGTAVTPEQAQLMRRYAPKATVCYDSDEAGQTATLKALDLLDAAGVAASVCLLTDGKDPDEFIKAHGGEAFQRLKTLDSVAYRLHRAARGKDLSSQEGRTEYAIEAAAILRRLPDPVVVEQHVRDLAVKTGFSPDILWQQIGKPLKQDRDGRAAGSSRYRDAVVAARQPEHEKAADQLLSLMVRGRLKPGPWGRPVDFPGEVRIALAAILWDEGASASRIRSWVEAMEDEKRVQAMAILALEVDCEDARLPKLIEDCVTRMRRPALEEALGELMAQRETMAADDPRQIVIAGRIMELDREIRRLNEGRKE